MTSPSDQLTEALAIWPLDREQVSLLHKAIAKIDQAQGDRLSVLLHEAEEAVVSCASMLATEAQVPARKPRLPSPRIISHPVSDGMIPSFLTSDQLIEILRNTIVTMVRREIADLSARQLAVFLNCYLMDGGHTVRGLAADLRVSKPAITRALDRLSELDLARRKVDPLDRRSVLVQRTMTGTSLLRKLRSILADSADPMLKEMLKEQMAGTKIGRATARA